ncbi:branched chain amino acid aminotransferase [Hymenobacter qilianensis]|uniref:branched-chain-amino-acid transaminase n=2 Tax=Hymenobacter qilianensis TaxID=1385715 RepID=A0A7H0GSU1_9BACT|nr:aminotransferase class IV [Hymenobacter qilianensis]QNP51357.1 aminotransferase class IV family protein [Hymenobacter qilianensis]GGF76052.1 branched chain amino acid aminotransferase [Hymenobacter qilianensis]
MPANQPLYAYIHGQITPLEQAFLHVSDLAIQRGYGVFDFFKVHAAQPLFLDYYLNRFYQSAQLMELTVPLARPALIEVIQALIRRNDLPLSGIKMILTGGYSADGYNPVEPNLLIIQQPLMLPTPEQVARGIKVITHDYLREIPPAKTINYSMGIRLIKQIKAQDADDVLYHHQGFVTEFPRANFFLVKHDNTVVTPATNVLAGITRRNVLALTEQPYPVTVGTVTLDDIYQAKEAFLTSTTKRVLPVVQIDDVVLGTGKPGPVTMALLQALLQMEEQQQQTVVIN